MTVKINYYKILQNTSAEVFLKNGLITFEKEEKIALLRFMISM